MTRGGGRGAPLRRAATLASILAVGALAWSCGTKSSTFVETPANDDNDDGNGGDISFTTVGSGGSGGSTDPNACDPTEDNDFDGDGYSIADGDCNDCEPNVGPAAVEVITDPDDPEALPVDENCDGDIDEVATPCDFGFELEDTDPMNAVRTMGMCDHATPIGTAPFGVVQAYWVNASGGPADPDQKPQIGIHQTYGDHVMPQEGDSMLVLSSGAARVPGQPDAPTNHYHTVRGGIPAAAPAGFPQTVPGCSGTANIFDDIGLEVVLRAPANATGFKYRFKFHSFEFAEWVCTTYNDQYIALVDPPPDGSINGNISFDVAGNPVSVNIAYFDVCDADANDDFASACSPSWWLCPDKPQPYCPLGPDELLGTGFDDTFGANSEDAGATAWLETTAPVEPGQEFTVRFAIWDSGDAVYDSTVVLDGFSWVATPGTTVITEPPK